MSKRPSLLANIDMKAEEGCEAPKVVELPTQVAPATQKTANVKTSLYLPPQAHRKLKEIAFAMDCKVHDLVIEGVNKVLKDKGFPSVSELAKS